MHNSYQGTLSLALCISIALFIFIDLTHAEEFRLQCLKNNEPGFPVIIRDNGGVLFEADFGGYVEHFQGRMFTYGKDVPMQSRRNCIFGSSAKPRGAPMSTLSMCTTNLIEGRIQLPSKEVFWISCTLGANVYDTMRTSLEKRKFLPQTNADFRLRVALLGDRDLASDENSFHHKSLLAVNFAAQYYSNEFSDFVQDGQAAWNTMTIQIEHVQFLGDQEIVPRALLGVGDKGKIVETITNATQALGFAANRNDSLTGCFFMGLRVPSLRSHVLLSNADNVNLKGLAVASIGLTPGVIGFDVNLLNLFVETFGKTLGMSFTFQAPFDLDALQVNGLSNQRKIGLNMMNSIARANVYSPIDNERCMYPKANSTSITSSIRSTSTNSAPWLSSTGISSTKCSTSINSNTNTWSASTTTCKTQESPTYTKTNVFTLSSANVHKPSVVLIALALLATLALQFIH